MLSKLINISGIASLLFTFLFSVSAIAKEGKDQIIDKIVTTYGGDNLIKLNSIQVIDRFSSFRFGQSYRPDEVDVEHNLSELMIDLAGNKVRYRWISGDKNYISTRHWLFNGSSGFGISDSSKTLSETNDVTFDNADRQHRYLLDILLVKQLHKNRHSAEYIGAESIYGVPHEVIKFSASGYEITLYVEQNTAQLTQMSRKSTNNNQLFRYHFSDYKEQQGLLYAGKTYLTRDGQPNKIVTARQIAFNVDTKQAFLPPSTYGETPKGLDTSTMTINKLADNVYFAGQYWGYSVFIDVGDYYLAAGGYDNLTERYNAIKQLSGNDKPLKYLVVSHHHNDHLAGMKEAAELGAIFITVPEHIASIREVVSSTLDDNRFINVTDFLSLAGDKVQVVDLPNDHASHNLMTYIPSAKLLFTADMYFSRQLEGSPNGYEGLYNIKKAIVDRKLDVQHFAAAHSPRILTLADFNYSLNNMVTPVCPMDWQLCQIWMNN